jgi:hypothetical protein
LAKLKFIHRDEIGFRTVVSTQHMDISIHLVSQNDERDPLSFSQVAYLAGNIVADTKLKWSRLVLEIHSNNHMSMARKPLDSLGTVEGLPDALFVRAFWPSETFGQLAVLVANNRIVEVLIRLSPIKYRSATLHGISLSTRTYAEFLEEFNLVNGPRQKKRRDTAEQSVASQ